MVVDRPTIDRLERLALARAPREACAVVRPVGQRWVVEEVENVADDPLTDFLIPRAVVIGPRDIVWHSHPVGPHYPSVKDQRQQMWGDNGWMISARAEDETLFQTFSFGDQFPRQPLKGRVFRHFVADCYTLIRDAYALRQGVNLPDFERPARWWEEAGGNVIFDNLQAAGFVLHEADGGFTPAPGDVALLAVNNKGVVNHLAYLMPEGMLLHHLENRLSKEDNAEMWLRYVKGWARYERRHTLA